MRIRIALLHPPFNVSGENESFVYLRQKFQLCFSLAITISRPPWDGHTLFRNLILCRFHLCACCKNRNSLHPMTCGDCPSRSLRCRGFHVPVLWHPSRP